MAFFVSIRRNTIFIFVIIILLDNSVLEFMVGVTFIRFVAPIVFFVEGEKAMIVLLSKGGILVGPILLLSIVGCTPVYVREYIWEARRRKVCNFQKYS